MFIRPRGRARKPLASLQALYGRKLPRHRSRRRAALPSTPITGPGAEDGRRRPEHIDSQVRRTGLTVAMAKAPWTGCQKLV